MIDTSGMSAEGLEKFTRFRRKLEDVVTSAINSGKTIWPSSDGRFPEHSTSYVEGRCCPLGCHPEAESQFPSGFLAQRNGWDQWEGGWLHAFARGFDGSKGDDIYSQLFPAYHQLGRLYRQRFMVKQ